MSFRGACVFALSLSIGGVALAQDAKTIRLKTCPAETSSNDPTISVRKIMAEHEPCTGRPLEITILDARFGFEAPIKTLFDVTRDPVRIPATPVDVFDTHRSCRHTYEGRGTIEWLIPKSQVCGGREGGWYYRVYTPDNKVCVMPGNKCITVTNDDSLAVERFKAAVQVAQGH